MAVRPDHGTVDVHRALDVPGAGFIITCMVLGVLVRLDVAEVPTGECINDAGPRRFHHREVGGPVDIVLEIVRGLRPVLHVVGEAAAAVDAAAEVAPRVPRARDASVAGRPVAFDACFRRRPLRVRRILEMLRAEVDRVDEVQVGAEETLPL